MDGIKAFGVSDMTTISDIDETGINNNLKLRYENDLIYTYTGSILVAVNPYKELSVFTNEYVFKYHGKKLGSIDPHVFALAEAALKNIEEEKINQSCVISGESGAGKTETTKFILQYLCSVTCDVSTWVQQQILEANIILEAFGNAKTIRNDNSSRFGKFMQICFDSKFCIRGCIIQDYLLEQSRITFQSPGERNYHVLYQLVAQGQINDEMSTSFHLERPDFYRYLNASGDVQIDIFMEAKKFEALRMAFTVLQIPHLSIDGLIRVLSAILWLGNIDFVDIDGERCFLTTEDKTIISRVSALLGVEDENMFKACLHRQINVRGNITEIPLKIQEARENRHAMAKALYSRTFAWLISQINNCINPGQDGRRFFGVLDIFGFENFTINSFEQLCINYTNEKLHKFFNHYVFALEQEIYKQEEIKYSHIEFTDNTLCLELIEKPPRCILKLLTEQCHMPKGSDVAYLNNLHTEFECHMHFIKGSDRRHWETEFGIQHYAGCVIYTVEGFVDKNRDVQQDVLFDYMSRSDNTFVQELALFQDVLSIASQHTSTFQRGTSKGKLTVSDSFRQQLQALIDVLQNTNPWYVRCIKPNANKIPNTYNDAMVLDQLKYLGMLDIIRIRREGFPVHLAFDVFISKYRCLFKQRFNNFITERADAIMTELNIKNNEWQIGKSKVFLRSHAYETLELARTKIENNKALVLQKSWRCYIERKKYVQIKKSVHKIQHAYRGWKLRIQFIKKRRSAIVIQSHLRGVFAREVAAALREMRRVDEEMKKRERLEAEKINDKFDFCNKEDIRDNKMELEECERLVQEDMMALSHMADQINTKLYQGDSLHEINGKKMKSVGETFQHNSDSVDLDNLFAFLSDVTPNSPSNHLLEEINENMDSLVQDLDEELENVISQDFAELPPENTANIDLNNTNSTLPAPTMPPPPPPPTTVHRNETPNLVKLTFSLTDIVSQCGKPEPIYEAVIPKELSTEFFKKTNISSEDNVNNWGSPEEPFHQLILPPNSNSNMDSLKCVSPQKLRSSSRPLGVQSTEKEQRRKHRVEKKLQEMHQVDISSKHKEVLREDLFYDLLDFAKTYFNVHERTPEGTIIATLTRKGKKSSDIIPKFEMITFARGEKIPTSHIHMYDPENVFLACNIFRELCKYMRGETNSDRELQLIQYIIGFGIEREELRDEIFVQCMRQATNNPHVEWMDRIWLLMCLIIVAFQPSKLLFRYYVSFLKNNLASLDGKLRQYAQWCFDNCKCTKVSPRIHPPSSVEVAAMRRLGTIVCRFFFLDGRTKAIDVHPTDSAGDAVIKLADKLNLSNIDGWAIYQSRPDGEEHLKSHDYLYDIIAAWELKQVKVQSGGSANRRFLNNTATGENRFVFKKRLYKSTRELSQDPVEVNMLYAQAVYSVVKCDDFPVSEKVALQLAGLQAQVSLGDPSNLPKPEYYTDVHNFLPERISKTREEQFWVPILAQAHRQYGASRNDLTAKVLYLSCVMQYPLYGTTMFPVLYRGYWSYGNNIILGVNCEGIMLIQPEDKYVLYQYKYNEIESILLDPSDCFITITLSRMNQQQVEPQKQQPKSLNLSVDLQRCFVFETSQKSEIGALIVSYFPGLSNWIVENQEVSKKCKGITNEDRVRLYQNVVVCRRQLIDAEILRKPQDTTGGFLRNTLRRLSKHRLEKLRSENGAVVQDHGETYKGFSHAFWAFSRQQILQSLSKLSDQEESMMQQIFQAILTYSGLGTSGDLIQKAEDEHITIIQSIMERCMRKESLLNELYLQLIKQTTDHPDPNSRVNLRHWALLSLACSVILPTVKDLRKYLIGHLKRCASDFVTEEGKYARFAEKCFFRTQGTRRRQWPPSREEIICTINRRPIYARFHFMDGQYHSVEFHPCSTALEVIKIVKQKIGLNEYTKGYAIYEVLGSSERSLLAEEKVSDVMSKWEKYRNAAFQASQQNQTSPSSLHCRRQHHIFLFKKHIFLDDYVNLNDPVEKELLYHQVLHSLRSERFPVSEMEAIMLTALQGQLELGDWNDAINNYRVIASHCLPPRFVPNIPNDAVAMHHQSLRGMLPAEAKKSFLNLIQSWPLHRATIFDVMQSFTSNWPRVLWLAVDQNGIHLLEHRSRNTLCTYDFTSILSYSPNMNCLMIITGTDKKQSKIILTTSQAYQIANLIREYRQVISKKISSSMNLINSEEEVCYGVSHSNE